MMTVLRIMIIIINNSSDDFFALAVVPFSRTGLCRRAFHDPHQGRLLSFLPIALELARSTMLAIPAFESFARPPTF